MAEQISVAPTLPPTSVDFNALHDMIVAKKPASEEQVKAHLDGLMPKPEAAKAADAEAPAPNADAEAPASQEN